MQNLFLFTGEESYLLQQKLKFWQKNFQEKHGEFNLSLLDGLREDAKVILNECETLPFLGEKRLVIIENLPPVSGAKVSEEKLKILLDFLPKLSETSVLVFVQAKPDKRMKFYKALTQLAQVENFNLLDEAELQKWVLTEINKREGKILPAAVPYLINKTGNNLWLLHNEIDKLIAYTNGKPISENDIDKLVIPVFDVNVFKLTDYIGAKQGQKAIETLHQLMESGSNSFQIFNMIIRQFRIFLQILDLQNKPSKEIASTLKLHPFVVQNALRQIKRFSTKELREIYGQLLKIDVKLKTGGIKVSTTNENMFLLEIEKLILNLSQ